MPWPGPTFPHIRKEVLGVGDPAVLQLLNNGNASLNVP